MTPNQLSQAIQLNMDASEMDQPVTWRRLLEALDEAVAVVEYEQFRERRMMVDTEINTLNNPIHRHDEGR